MNLVLQQTHIAVIATKTRILTQSEKDIVAVTLTFGPQDHPKYVYEV